MQIFNKKYIKESLKYLLRSSFFINKYVKEIDALYEMTPMELKKRNEKRFLEIFNKAFTSSAYYRNLCKSVGVTSIDDIKHIEDIVKLPILTKDMLKKHGKELLTCKEKGLIKNHTSGTTGTPLTVYQDWKSVWREQAYFVCYRKRCGYNYGEPMVSLRGNLGRNDISLKVHVSNTLFLSSYNINENTAETYYQLIEKHHPKAIEGYPSSLYNLALVLRDKGLECHIPVAFTSSETLHDYQRNLIEKTFHTQIYDHYGTTERTIRLEESFEHDGYFEDPGYGIEEYHDDYVITTSLINDTFPLIRYKTNDRVVLKSNTILTHASEPMVKRVEGRSVSFIIGKDGTKYSDAALTFIFKETHGIRLAQFVQNEVGKIFLNVVPESNFSEKDKDEILKNIDQKIGKENIDVDFRLIDESQMQYTKKNKLALVISNL
jgi:phenylacetate-CoA ligase